ncbi:hypothetical protein AVEN_248277-1 [Araneus ventricosus]|uniref:Uncharacterized protein n=1 Tax=Araneus ventricosus TaxID=182803 RepID=A0A4Y2KBY4_ARAVE|nr:hypothetical protein AVEN_248277-1 [Araneus ventricosus]
MKKTLTLDSLETIWNNLLKFDAGRGGLVVRSGLWGRRAPGPKQDSIEDPPCMGPAARQTILSGQTSSRWCGGKLGEEMPEKVSFSSSGCGWKLQDLSQNSLHAASKTGR